MQVFELYNNSKYNAMISSRQSLYVSLTEETINPTHFHNYSKLYSFFALKNDYCIYMKGMKRKLNLFQASQEKSILSQVGFYCTLM